MMTSIGADAGIARRLLVLADGEEVAAEHRAVQHEPGDDRATTASTIDRDRDAADAGDEEIEAGIFGAEGEAGGGVGGVAARDAAIDQQAAQRHDEGLHLAAW